MNIGSRAETGVFNLNLLFMLINEDEISKNFKACKKELDSMLKDKVYAKYKKEDVIWEVVYDNKDGTFDISIDDLQGDITVCYVDISNLTFVTKEDYDKRILELK
jgi:hypothetical protein